MSSACDVCPEYFRRFSACPTVPLSDFSERPWEFLVSLEMAIVSSNQMWDFIIILALFGTMRNRLFFLITYLVPTLLTSQVFKPFFRDPRPILSCISGYGMPSGHSTAAGVIFAATIVLYSRGWIRSFWFAVFYCALMVNEAFSRIYLHYHTEHQVIYGFSWGVIAAFLIFSVLPISPAPERTRSGFSLPSGFYSQNSQYVKIEFQPIQTMPYNPKNSIMV